MVMAVIDRGKGQLSEALILLKEDVTFESPPVLVDGDSSRAFTTGCLEPCRLP